MLFRFIDELSEINQINYTFSSAFKYVIFLSPEMLREISSLGVLLGIVSSLGYFVENRELQIYLTGGLSKKIIAINSVKIGLLIWVSIFILLDLLIPYSSIHADKYKSLKINNQNNISFVNKKLNMKLGNKFIFIEKLNEGKYIKNILTIDHKDSNFPEIAYSDNGFIDSAQFTLKDPKVFNISADRSGLLNVEVIRLPKQTINLDSDLFDYLKVDVKNLSIFQLIRQAFSSVYISNTKDANVELIIRLTSPLLLTSTLLIAIPFAFSLSRSTLPSGKRPN